MIEVRLFSESAATIGTGFKLPRNLEKRVLEVVKKTAGGAMETLGKPGWMTHPDPSEVGVVPSGTARKLTPFAYVFQDVLRQELREADREAYMKDPSGCCPLAIREFMQWWWIVQWDGTVEGKAKSIDGALKLYPKSSGDFIELARELANWKNGFNEQRQDKRES